MEYAFVVTEPEYDEYQHYPVIIDTSYGNDYELIFNQNKKLYIGKTLYFDVFLNEDLTSNCINNICELCKLNAVYSFIF